MVGVYRFILAVLVVQAHTLSDGIPAQFAVFSFYTLSGFLMTLILNENYGFGFSNFLRFWANRLLRLYPAYWFAVAIVVLHIWFVGPMNVVHGNVGIPESVRGVFANVTMFGLAGFDIAQQPSILFVPNAWSLGVELFSYFLISLYFARNVRRAACLLAWRRRYYHVDRVGARYPKRISDLRHAEPLCGRAGGAHSLRRR